MNAIDRFKRRPATQAQGAGAVEKPRDPDPPPKPKLPKPPDPVELVTPTDDLVDAHLKSAAGRRASRPSEIADRDLLRRILKRRWCAGLDIERTLEEELDNAARVLADAAPIGAKVTQLYSYLIIGDDDPLAAGLPANYHNTAYGAVTLAVAARASGVSSESREHGGCRGLAHQFVREHAIHKDGPTLRRWRGGWYRWSVLTGCYREISDEELEKELYVALDLQDRRRVGDVRHALIAVEGVLIDERELGSWLGRGQSLDPLEVAAARNGILHLPTGRLVSSTPDYFATSTLGCAWQSTAPTPARWLKFLSELWPDDDESIATLQEIFGLLLVPDTRQQKIGLLVGPKRAGKNVITRVLTALLGRDSVVAPTLAQLATNFGLAPLIGKTVAIVEDARLSGRSDIAQVTERLLSISGEGQQTVDRKHRPPWTGYLTARFLVVTNELPRLDDASGAIAGRLIVLKLTQSWFGKEDTNLTDKLLGELPGILNWAITGWCRLRERGRLVQPASGAELVDEIADLGSPVAAWFRERCDPGTEHAVVVETAYADHRAWCGRNGMPHPRSSIVFGRDLRAVVPGLKRLQVPVADKGRPWHYSGFRLKST